MLGQDIKNIIEDKELADKLEIQRFHDSNNKKQLKRIQTIENFIQDIKKHTEALAQGKQKIKLDKKGRVFLFSYSESNVGHYNSDLYSNSAEEDVLDILGKLKLPISKMLAQFCCWLDDQQIKAVYSKYEHDGVGIKSWNSYYIEVE